MNKKLCLIFSSPSHYRESIYKLIDLEFNCDWFFSDEDAGIKTIDYNILKSVKINKFKKLGRRLGRIIGIQKLLADSQYDDYLMLLGSVNVSIWWFLIRAKIFYPRKRIYLWGHGWYGKESKIERIIKRLIFKASTGVFVYGEYSKKKADENGCDISKIHVIHNSLNYDKQLELRESNLTSNIYKDHFNNNNPILIFIGRFTSIKKLNQIIEAINILKQKGESYNLILVGDGPEKENLIKLSQKLNLSESIWFYGESYDEKINAELIYNADLCISPGNVGLTAIHSLMFGTPVITHNNFPLQMPEFEAINPGISGNFFNQDDIEDLATKISNWFSNIDESRKTIRENCYKVIDKDWNPYAQIEIIKNIISN